MFSPVKLEGYTWQRESTDPVFVHVLIIEDAFPSLVMQVISRRRDVNVQPRRGVDPPRINNIRPIVRLPMLKVRIDLEEEASIPVRAILVLVVPGGHVVVGGQEEHVCLADLDIRIQVPRHDLMSCLSAWYLEGALAELSRKDSRIDRVIPFSPTTILGGNRA